MASKVYRHFRDTKRARLMREYAAKRGVPRDVGDAELIEHLYNKEGNIFAQFGFTHPEQELLKALLTVQICRIVKEQNLTQKQAGEVLGITQREVSSLKRNRLSNFSVGRL